MINKQELKELGFESIHFYFDLIIDMEKVNSENSYLIERLSPSQKKDLIYYIEELHISRDDEMESIFHKTLKLL